jgi:cellulose synthase/poly-beta-1,6-N-acetylglucosamine synthase-like glycosyltransferase
MTPMVELFLCALAFITLLPASVLALQVLVAFPRVTPQSLPEGRRPCVAVLMPAHNEALLIGASVRAVLRQLAPGDRLLVVADNCSDETARIAVAAGAEAIERHDGERRGKSYALDFGVRHLQRDPPEIVLVLDADCDIDAESVSRLAATALAANRPAQALYLMHAPVDAGLRTRIAAFAWLVKNQVRALGFHRLGLPCPLMGSGMAFPWLLIAHATLASGHLSEDFKLGADLALAGTPPLFCPEARVDSYFPAAAAGIASQRMRWEHGHLWVIIDAGPRLFREALRRRDPRVFALALDLCVPPLALLLLLATVVLTVNAAFYLLTALAAPLALSVVTMMLLGSAVLLAWWGYGRRIISLASLACAPLYALWKIPLYCKFVINRQVEWVRSKRDGE